MGLGTSCERLVVVPRELGRESEGWVVDILKEEGEGGEEEGIVGIVDV